MPCRAEAAQLAKLHAAGIAVAGIAVRDTPADAAAFVDATGARFDHAGLDPHERTQTALGTSGIPETFVVDGSGIVRAHFRGSLHPDAVARVAAAAAAAR